MSRNPNKIGYSDVGRHTAESDGIGCFTPFRRVAAKTSRSSW